jgi:hypothetical protein
MTLFGLMEILKNLIINSNKLLMNIVERKVVLLAYVLEVFDMNLSDLNFFFLNKYILNKYLSILSYKLNYINIKKNEISDLPFFLSSTSEFNLYKSYQFIEILKLFK